MYNSLKLASWTEDFIKFSICYVLRTELALEFFPSQYLERVTTWEYMQFFPPRGIKELAVCIAHTTCPYLTLCASPLPSFGRDYCDVLIYKLLFPDLQLWCQFTIGNSTTLVAKVVLYEMFLQRWRLLMWARAWQMSQRLLSVMSGKVELLFLMLLRSWFLQSRLMCKNQLSVWECVGVSPTLLGFTPVC